MVQKFNIRLKVIKRCLGVLTLLVLIPSGITLLATRLDVDQAPFTWDKFWFNMNHTTYIVMGFIIILFSLVMWLVWCFGGFEKTVYR